MDRSRPKLTIRFCMLAIVCAALNFWLFRYGVLIGLIGLNLSKHLTIAYLCHVLGVGRVAPKGPVSYPADRPPGIGPGHDIST